MSRALDVVTLAGEEYDALREENERLRGSRDFYMHRCEVLQAVQNKMRDPERKAVCDILANGSTTALSGPVQSDLNT